MSENVSLYSAVGEKLARYSVDVEAATLARRETVQLLANAQYAWPHPSRRYLYVATSNRGSATEADFNHVSAFRIEENGALAPHGEPRVLRDRAVHICVDGEGRYLLSAHNVPRPGISVSGLNDDGTIGRALEEPRALDYGIYPHQVLVTPSNRAVILVDRGNSPEKGKPEDPGALRVFGFENGVLTQRSVTAPNGGYGFGPRHVDFHPTKPWVYVSDERHSKLHMFRMPGDALEAAPAYTRDSLQDPANVKPRQLAGPIHVHPNGRVVYVVNRGDYCVDYEGRRVFGGGENSIAVFAIDQDSGEPKLIQHADTHSFHVRTFSIDPSARLLVAASIKPLAVREGTTVKETPAALSLFRIDANGRLEFARKYDVETDGRIQYWMGMV